MFALHDTNPTTSNDVRFSAYEVATAFQSMLAGMGDLTDETGMTVNRTFTFPGVTKHAYLMLDLVLDRAGRIRCVECNTSNAAGSSVANRDIWRVEHELDVMLARSIDVTGDVVMLTPESPDTRSTPEIRTRAMLRALMVGARSGTPVSVAHAGCEALRPGPAAVWGTIPEMADHLTLDASGLRFRGRQVVFLNNPNLLVQLARRLQMPVETLIAQVAGDGIQPDPIHEGGQIALLGLDKIAQQNIAAKTNSITPVFSQMLLGTVDDMIDLALDVARRFNGAILKPMAASGGTGVIPVDRCMTVNELRIEMEAAARKLESKYGRGWQETCPMGVFEFIHAMPAVTEKGGHRWDLRLQVAASPERTQITPLSARLCPEPMGDVLNRDNSVNNLTGRSTSTANRLATEDLLAMLGADDQLLDRFATAAFEYAQHATRY